MSFLYYYYRGTQVNGAIRGEMSAGVGSDGMIKMVLLHAVSYHHINQALVG